MKKILILFTLYLVAGLAKPAFGQTVSYYKGPVVTDKDIVTGAAQVAKYAAIYPGKRMAVVANQTSVVSRANGGFIHLVDTLVKLKTPIAKIFAPEHGFRGTADAGEHVNDSVDMKTGLAMVSLYGKNAKPDSAAMADVDIVLFDIQDVGARFYTYISTLHNIMEACAEFGKPLIVLDRPNPNGFYIDGPILDTVCRSFVGMHQIPIVHGMTIGEYAKMINGEYWLKDSVQCQLTVVTMEKWEHTMLYQLPIAPSPNLKTMQSVYLYPSLCLFEGTNVSVGRGTATPFEMYGSPLLQKMPYTFTPKSMPGSKKPMHIDKLCYGENLHYDIATQGAAMFTLDFVLKAYANTAKPDDFFVKNSFFEKLCGRVDLRDQIKDKVSYTDIKTNWQPGLDAFKQVRKKYLLYKDFE
jgi:uncharacterized protein YbbC (DUF1343 family)